MGQGLHHARDVYAPCVSGRLSGGALALCTFEHPDQRLQLFLHSQTEALKEKSRAGTRSHRAYRCHRPQHHAVGAEDHLDWRSDCHAQPRPGRDEAARETYVEYPSAEDLRSVGNQYLGLTVDGVAIVAA